LGSLQKIWLNYKDLLLLISFTITLMVDWPAPQIALDLQKGARFAYSQLDHGPSWRCARETTGDPTRFGSFSDFGPRLLWSFHPRIADMAKLLRDDCLVPTGDMPYPGIFAHPRESCAS
jgi:hypothetical protein